MDANRILSITAQGLTYHSDNGIDVFIDFIACHENSMECFLEPDNLNRWREINNLNDDALKRTIERTKAQRLVGERNILRPPWADGPYIEFYTEPPTRFRFASDEDFQHVRAAIEEYGWRTADRS